MTSGAVKTSDQLAQDRTDLALERTLMAADRTLMAWVRTSLSMISFGFTIFKFLQSVQSGPAIRPEEPRNIGLVLVSMGVVSLLLASVQYVGHVKRLGTSTRAIVRSLTLWVAGMVGIVGLLALLNIGFKIGPF